MVEKEPVKRNFLQEINNASDSKILMEVYLDGRSNVSLHGLMVLQVAVARRFLGLGNNASAIQFIFLSELTTNQLHNEEIASQMLAASEGNRTTSYIMNDVAEKLKNLHLSEIPDNLNIVANKFSSAVSPLSGMSDKMLASGQIIDKASKVILESARMIDASSRRMGR